VSIDDIRWADVICAMEQKHKNRLTATFSRAARDKRIVVLDIPDDYQFMDPELVGLIDSAVQPILDLDSS
jgi:predicted protein tyrosine phosphatase